MCFDRISEMLRGCWYPTPEELARLEALAYLVVSVIVEVCRKRFDGIGGNLVEALFWPIALVGHLRLDKAFRFLMHGKG